MYGALWRILPGPIWVRILILLALATVVVLALVVWVYPYVDQLIAPQDVTVEQ